MAGVAGSDEEGISPGGPSIPRERERHSRLAGWPGRRPGVSERRWEAVIGLELHAQLATRSKIFSGASTEYGAAPNTQACAIDLGLPGVLPVLNRDALAMAVKFGLAVGATIARRSVFARKNYFYPDLPKGYQISQYELPIVGGGCVDIEVEGGPRRIGITRAHLEEDAGKSVHDAVPGRSGIDLNRAGVPLLEIVSEPDLRSAAEASAYMHEVHTIVRYLGICDGNLQEGSFRCDANVSVRPIGQRTLGTRVELKNLNSFRFVEKAIRHEIERQSDVLAAGGAVVQQTRLYDPGRDETRPLREKEEANDYRYFPDPDLLPVVIDDAFIESVRATLPELPAARRLRFASEHGLSAHEAHLLTSDRMLADYFETAHGAGEVDARLAARWVTGELSALLNREGVDIARCPVSPTALKGLLLRLEDGTLSGPIAKEVLKAMWDGEGAAEGIIESRGLRQVSDEDAIAKLVDSVISAHPEQVGQFRAGREKVLGFLVGQAMKASGGKANPRKVSELIRSRLAD